MPGLIIGLSLGSFMGYGTVCWGLKQKGIPIFVSDLKWTVLGLVIGLIGGVTPWIVGPLLDVDPQLASLAIGPLVLLPYAVYAGRLTLGAIRSRPRS